MINVPTITTDRFTMRPFTIADFKTFAKFYASDRSIYSGGVTGAESSWRMLACEIGHWQLRGYGRWAVEDKETGKLAGNVGLWCPNGWPEPEIGWDIYEGFVGRGYATEAALEARRYAYDKLGWTTVISLIKPQNDSSKKVAQRMGARFEKVFTHERFGETEIWRHMPASDLHQGGMDIYA